jgi:hypothetical protein
MDITGAQALSRRIAQQEHWREARAVRVGYQPPSDPDGSDLESFRSGLRVYRERQRLDVRDGRPAMVTCRLEKRLVDGVWEAEMVVLDVQQVA